MTLVSDKMVEEIARAISEELLKCEGFGGPISLGDVRSLAQAAATIAQGRVEELTEALKQIAIAERAPEFEPTVTERATYWHDAAIYCREIARSALNSKGTE